MTKALLCTRTKSIQRAALHRDPLDMAPQFDFFGKQCGARLPVLLALARKAALAVPGEFSGRLDA